MRRIKTLTGFPQTGIVTRVVVPTIVVGVLLRTRCPYNSHGIVSLYGGNKGLTIDPCLTLCYKTLTERWGFFVLSKSDSQVVQVGFCLEMVYDTYLVLWKSRQKIDIPGEKWCMTLSMLVGKSRQKCERTTGGFST